LGEVLECDGATTDAERTLTANDMLPTLKTVYGTGTSASCGFPTQPASPLGF
jgi:hypothetical protein